MEHRILKVESDMNELREANIDIRTRLAVAESNIKDVKEDISSIKSNTTWILRIIISFIVLALLGLLTGGV